MEFPHLFSPIKINNMELKNRIVMTAMHLGYTPQGEVTDRLIDFYALRAEGGVGLIMVGGCPIDEHGGMVGMIGLNDDRYIPGLQRLTRAIKDRGARIAAQLYQAGRYTHSSMIGGEKPISASAVRSKLTGETPRALDMEEIPGVQKRFAEAALRAKTAGFDAVEILGSAGYLISQFLSPVTNRRDDAYGGSLENRMRFGLEVIEKTRAAVGLDYPVILRIAGNEFMEGGNTNAEARVFAKAAEGAGIDLFNVTGGWHETRVPQLTMSVPRGAYVYLAQGIKAAVNVPVLVSNRINDPAAGEAIVRNGQADMVTMARGLLADPDLPKKALNGNAKLIYHCVACNQGCFDRIFRGKPATCLVNPRAGVEADTRVKPADEAKKVLVIGGGPAGMKVACVAAQRGHRVALMEKTERLGGQLLLNQMIPGREELLTAIKDLEHNLEDLGVDIQRQVTADVKRVKAVGPDVVVIATGARPVAPRIPGIDGPHVFQAWDVLAGHAGVGHRVAILGGNAVGLETALYLASVGTLTPEALHFLMVNRAESLNTLTDLLNKGIKSVTVVEMTKKAGADVGLTTKWTIMGELKRLGVKIMTETEAVGITPEGLEIRNKNGDTLIEADTVVLAAGSHPVNGLREEIEAIVPQVHVIGDAKDPRNALSAIREGFEVGRAL
ncbi:MAG: FAD-dependent oxidoreductase [Deltaproteobacteria bacterium]|nr:FAD-dependent oxidoreductase [Deltaproteobacteria bacterium]